jgi:hypothetical protein
MMHFTMILTLIFSNGQVQVQTIPNFTSFATCQIAGEQLRSRIILRRDGSEASYSCVMQ